MQTFLDQQEATFYHITTLNNWEHIKKYGLISKSGRIFVSRVGELPVLIAIAFEQLPEIYSTINTDIVFLKLPQVKNKFTVHEVIPDNQANEWTQQFQNIILRKNIPLENIELMLKLPLDIGTQREYILNYFSRIAMLGYENYLTHYINERAKQIKY